MNNLEINKKALQKLAEFDAIDCVETSEKWEAVLQKKLVANQIVRTNFVKNYTLLLVGLVLLNSSLITYFVIGNTNKNETKITNLRLISNELLISSNH